MPSKLFQFLSKYDEFGHPISLNYIKSEEYKTWCGTVLSWIKIILLLIYFSHIALVCFHRRDPDIQFSEVYRDWETLEPVEPVELGFDVAFELMVQKFTDTSSTFEEAKKAGIDDTYFNVTAYAATSSLEDGSSLKEVEIHDCLEFEAKTGRRPFKYMSKEKFETKLKYAKCVDMEHVEFEGTVLEGRGLNLVVLQCKDSDEPGSPQCATSSEIDEASKITQVVTFVSQNYFAIDNYTDPIQAELGMASLSSLSPDKVVNSQINVQYSVVELFDTQFRIFDDIPQRELEYASAALHLQTTAPSLVINDQKVYSSNAFFLTEKGTLYKRRVITVFNVLEDIGGMEEAICLVMAPFVMGIAARSFNYDLVSRHMKVKTRNGKQVDMPTDIIDDPTAKSIFKMAGLQAIDKVHKVGMSLIFCPRFCHKKDHTKKIAKLMARGGEQYENATDVLSIIRVQHRLKILEQLLFSKGQLAMIGLHKQRYLKPASSESEEELVRAPDSEDDLADAIHDTCEMLNNHQFTTEIDRRLWEQCILPPKERHLNAVLNDNSGAQINNTRAVHSELSMVPLSPTAKDGTADQEKS